MAVRHGGGVATAGKPRNERRGKGASGTCTIRAHEHRCARKPGADARAQLERTPPPGPAQSGASTSTAKIIAFVAGRLPLSAKRPTRPEIHISQGHIAKPPPPPLEDVRSSVVSLPSAVTNGGASELGCTNCSYRFCANLQPRLACTEDPASCRIVRRSFGRVRMHQRTGRPASLE